MAKRKSVRWRQAKKRRDGRRRFVLARAVGGTVESVPMIVSPMPSSFFRFATSAAFAATLVVAAMTGAAANDARVVGHLSLSFGTGDWSLGVRTETGAYEPRRDEYRNRLRPALDLTARFSGPGGRFESLRFNNLPVVVRAPVLYADGTEESAPGVRWEYVALGLAGGVVVALIVVREAVVGTAEDVLDDAISGQ